jgi:hypothetical protein
MTETISHWADGKRQDGYSDRTGPVFGFPTGKEEVRVAFASVQEVDNSGLAAAGERRLDVFCPPSARAR